MNYLVDTQNLLWIFNEPRKVRPLVREIFLAEKGNVFYNPLSLWEISIKHGKGKLDLGNQRTPEEFVAELNISFFVCKPIKTDIFISSYRLPRFPNHSDPFDRLLIWDAISSGFTLISDDSCFEQYKQFGLLLL